MPDQAVAVEKVAKTFGKVHALREISLDVERGELVALLGASAAGKSTLLRIIAGVERASAGRLWFSGEDVTRVPAWKRNVAMAFESYVLYPNRTVAENMSFPLRRLLGDQPNGKGEIQRRVVETATMLQIDGLLDRLPHTLSGGQRQRVALGRALVREPNAMLLDEPIAHLDAKLRHWLRGELRRRLRDQGAATIWTTPDSTEAMAVSDRLVVIVEGRVEQLGPPAEVYAKPATARVAGLLGDPPMNLLAAESVGSGLHLDGCDSVLPLESDASSLGRGLVGVRPNELQISPVSSETSVPAVVVVTEPGAQRSLTTLRVGQQTMRVLGGPHDRPPSGAHVFVEWGGARVFAFRREEDQRLEAESRVVGNAVEMSIGGGR